MAGLGIPGFEDPVEVGRGAFGVVYRAHQVDFDRQVALKVLTGVLDAHAQARFDRERRAMGTLSAHPNIVAVHTAGVTEDGRPYLVMEFAPAGSMGDRLEREGALPWAEAVGVGAKLGTALAAAHAAGVLHRDVKPENVLISAFGEPMLSDFGIARLAGTPITRTGTVTASVAYAAPEVLEGKRPTEASDVYSLASTIFAFIAGRAPFVRETDESIVPIIARVAIEPPPDLRVRNVPDPVCAVLERGMAKDPSVRGAATAFAEALRDAAPAPVASRAAGATNLVALGSTTGTAPPPKPLSGPGPEEPPAAPAGPAAPEPGSFAPTHAVPAGGLPAWAAPDATQAPVATLDAGLEVQVLEQRGDGWGQVRCSNGWSGWVDGRRLGAPWPRDAAPHPEATPASPVVAAGAPNATIAPTVWAPTHVVPADGLWAWREPDPASAPAAALDPGLEVRLLDQRVDGWAHVLCSNGWSAWVDGRRLLPGGGR